MIKKLLTDILTTKSGNDFDNGRVLGTLVVISFLIFTAIDIYFNHKFDYINFGIASGSIFVGVGINLKFKENSEPNNS